MAASVDIPQLGASVEAAAVRIVDSVHRTPLDHSPFFSELAGAAVTLKMESEQVSGSFKARGAANKVLLLAEGGPAAFDGGLTSISTGNHVRKYKQSSHNLIFRGVSEWFMWVQALAFTHALQVGKASGAVPEDVGATVFVPEGAAPSKLENLRQHSAPLSVYPGSYDDAEAHARKLAEDSGGVFISAVRKSCILY